MVRPLKPMSATSLHRNYSPAPSSFATTWPPITIRLRLQLCAKLGAGSFICRHIRQTSILSKWHSQNSKHTCAELGQEHSTRCSTHLPKSAISSLLTNVGTSSARQDMDQVKSETLYLCYKLIICSHHPNYLPIHKNDREGLCCRHCVQRTIDPFLFIVA